MKYIMLFLLSSTALATDGTFVKYSVSAVGSPSSQKGISIGTQSDLFTILESKKEVGFWIDQTHRPGAKSSAFAQYSIGVEPTSGSFYINFFQGVGAISSKDSVLGGNFQFFEDVGVGIRDQNKGVAVGLHYKHISSAGIFKPNKGRDFLGLQIMLPF